MTGEPQYDDVMLTRQAATGNVNGMIELLPIVSDDNTSTSGA
jgi:hypothetical protein